MTTIPEESYGYDDLASKASELKAMFPGDATVSLPKDDLRRILESLTQPIEFLLQYITLSDKQIREALRHAAAKKIIAFTEKHPDVFGADYLRNEFKGCFKKGLRTGLYEPDTREDLRTAVICYRYFTSRTKKREKLGRWLAEIERHYNSINDGQSYEVPPDKKEALRHHESIQMVRFTKEKSRKGFFSPEYFQQKLRQLPAEVVRAARTETQTFKDPRDALIYSVYFGAPGDGRESALRKLHDEIEADFNRDPQVMRTKWMRDLCIDLMIRDDQREIARELAKKVPNREDLVDFARVNGLKMPRMRKTAPDNGYIWKGLAEQIHKKGALARMRVR